MKYRLLSDEELSIFGDDLKHFLIANGISAEEWERLNKEEVDKAIQLVEIFSDTVLQKVYENLKFIEHRSPQSCLVFHLKPESIELIALNRKDETVDLSTPESIHDALVNMSNKLDAFRSTKMYTGEREAEIHQMLIQGCVNSSEAFWTLLNKVIP